MPAMDTVRPAPSVSPSVTPSVTSTGALPASGFSTLVAQERPLPPLVGLPSAGLKNSEMSVSPIDVKTEAS